ncbi:MAG TPA: thiamine-phosphate kinase [Cryomorphaceae bacterium]|nr:thiamine-phosphate kinase [Owenweeksia sp.]MBG00529.1 thiamine-phosphate kinase [Owenweeksia sp.]HAD98484.1 thiamine-phosphate kinase [Cryomorphaceae bacterium]HCQ16950.1 thiamine-phosphate kinase [Cryomorphaceae bacterium]|tara:strand:+ start:2584 stop:3648 length:1065 start_codon:yes stop_codon:yes gene_type:complete
MNENQENTNEEFTPLSELGEFGLIDKLTQDFPLRNASSIKGVGDDAAVIEMLDKQTVVTTDMLVEGVHFDLTYVPPQHLGYKAVVVNLSDIYAMNGRPTQITVSLAVSNRFSAEFIEKIYEGIRAACNIYEVDLVGGDTTSSYSGLIISITAIGQVDEKDIVYRKGAKATDLLVVSGDLGGAYMGLQLLEREKSVYEADRNMQPNLEGYEYVLQRQLKPEARKDVPEILAALEVKPTSMIDVSDGLSSEILHLCRQSGVGMRLHEDKIPIDPSVYKLCEEFNLTTTTVALSGGEDYELLFTIDLQDYEKIKGNPNFTVIGHVVDKEEGANLFTRDDQAIRLTAQGWDAMLRADE